MRRLIIGDIHGCYVELQDLLAAAGLAAGDEIIAVGDILDRGPASPAVFDFFMSTQGARALQGNHERKHARSFRGEVAPALSQRIARWQFGEERYPAVCAELERFPTRLLLEEAVLVHGFFEPGVSPREQRDTVVVGTLSGEGYLRQRYDAPWYELYDGDRPIIVGHHDYAGTGAPFVYRDRVYGIDTACYRGGRLTGLLLPEFRFVSVPARADHWSAVRAVYAASSPQGAPGRADDELTWDELDRALSASANSVLSEDRRERLRRIRDEADRTAEAVLAAIGRESERLLASARELLPDGANEQALPSTYARLLGSRAHPGLFHLARKGQLTKERLRSSIRSPAALKLFASQIGAAG